MFSANEKIRLTAVFEMRIARVKITVISKHTGAAILKFTMVNSVVVIVERKKAEGRAAVHEQAVAVEDFRRGKPLVISNPDAIAGEVAESFIYVLHFCFKCGLRRMVESNRGVAAAIPT